MHVLENAYKRGPRPPEADLVCVDGGISSPPQEFHRRTGTDSHRNVSFLSNLDSGSQKLQRFGENRGFHTSAAAQLLRCKRKTRRIWNRCLAPSSNPWSFSFAPQYMSTVIPNFIRETSETVDAPFGIQSHWRGSRPVGWQCQTSVWY